MTRLKHIGVFSLGKFQALLAALVGFLCGVIYSFGGLFVDILVSAGMLSPEAMSTPGLSAGTVLAFGALIGMPLIFAVAGFVLGILEALLYNLFSSIFGGISTDLTRSR